MNHTTHLNQTKNVVACLLLLPLCSGIVYGATYKIHPANTGSQEEFENIANSLRPGDELILSDGIYSQTARRAVTVKGTADKPIT
ncbi:MAG: hypothetical protein ACYS3S_11090, partial [Planctomycetota bacterium]